MKRRHVQTDPDAGESTGRDRESGQLPAEDRGLGGAAPAGAGSTTSGPRGRPWLKQPCRQGSVRAAPGHMQTGHDGHPLLSTGKYREVLGLLFPKCITSIF